MIDASIRRNNSRFHAQKSPRVSVREQVNALIELIRFEEAQARLCLFFLMRSMKFSPYLRSK
jgi:hypothetical protein